MKTAEEIRQIALERNTSKEVDEILEKIELNAEKFAIEIDMDVSICDIKLLESLGYQISSVFITPYIYHINVISWQNMVKNFVNSI